MQEIHLLNTNKLFTTTTNSTPNSSIDRRLRHNHLQNQALNCPRCDSLNTKFCYYNNYNLSQPRHFCKSCRRYWTKGGVLRNVPIGGGCRKSSKRSSASVKESKLSDKVRSKSKSNNSNSGSESSSMTGSGIVAVGGDLTVAEISPSALTPPCTDYVVGKHILAHVRNPNFSPDLMNSAILGCETGGEIDGDGSGGGGGFADIGSFSNINNETTTYNFDSKSYDAVSAYQQFDRPYEQWQLSTEDGLGGGYMNPTVQIDQYTNIGSEPLNWYQEQQQRYMFGLTSAVDQGYWSQQQWSNNAHYPYLP